MTLTAEEEVAVRRVVEAGMQELQRFMQSDLTYWRPPLAFPDRDPGHRPLGDEDPYHAWLWKCRTEGQPGGALTGKTVSFKDIVPVANIPLTYGSYGMDGFIPDFDATVVRKTLLEGGIITGKNSTSGPTSSWGFGVPSDYDRPLNPHNPDHLTGGSSSGSAVAVAARDVDISFGGDQTGSIRIPAAFCGTYGLKATFGLISHFGISFGCDPAFDHVGPMALYVEDVAAALEATAGWDEGLDPRQSRLVPDRYEARLHLAEGIDGVRVAMLKEGFVEADPRVSDKVKEAAAVLERAGASISELSVPEHVSSKTGSTALLIDGYRSMFDVGFIGAFAQTYYPESLIEATHLLMHAQTDRILPWMKAWYVLGELSRRAFHGRAYARGQNMRRSVQLAFDQVFRDVDVLLMPTCLTTAPQFPNEPRVSDNSFLFTTGANTEVYGYTGHPALSVPCGKVDGLPVGMQLVGRYFDDSLLLRVAFAYQHSVDWDQIVSIGTAKTPARS